MKKGVICPRKVTKSHRRVNELEKRGRILIFRRTLNLAVQKHWKLVLENLECVEIQLYRLDSDTSPRTEKLSGKDLI